MSEDAKTEADERRVRHMDPMEAYKHPTIVPDDNGVPCVRDTGVSVTTVLRALSQAGGVVVLVLERQWEFRADRGTGGSLTRDDVCACLRWAADVIDSKRGAK